MIQAQTADVVHSLQRQSNAAATGKTQLAVWWLHPATLFTAVAGGTLLPALILSEHSYALYGMPKYLDVESLGLGVLACLTVACGVFFGARIGAAPRALSQPSRKSLVFWFYLATGLTLFGYAAWAANGVRHGFSAGYIADLISGTDDEKFLELKFEVFQTVPGVTTCTQFGLLAVMLGTILRGSDSRYLKPLLAAIVVLSAVRVFVISERLALVEVVVLMGLVWLRTRVLSRSQTSGVQFALSFVPVVGIVMLVVLMGMTEYFRSWKYYSNEYDSLAEFTVSRLFGYYSTSHNNGAMAWSMRGTVPLPYYTLEWFWHFPLISSTPFGYEKLAGIDPFQSHMEFLERWGNPEFNNPGGLFLPTLDFGVLGGVVFWLAFGLIAGRLYRSYLAAALPGLLLYPFIVLTILESPRFLYLCTVRPFAPLALTFFVLHRVSSANGGADVH